MAKIIRADEITLDASGGDVNVLGNLLVQGTIDTISTTNTSIVDTIIVLNSGESGAGVTNTYAGIEVDRGSSNTVSIRWNDTTDTWQLTNDGATYTQIATSPNGNPLENVVEDLTPQLGGNLDVNGNSFTSGVGVDIVVAPGTNGILQVDSSLLLEDTTGAPSMTAGYATLYSDTVSTGGTGVYTSSSAGQNEMMSAKQALIYSLLL